MGRSFSEMCLTSSLLSCDLEFLSSLCLDLFCLCCSCLCHSFMVFFSDLPYLVSFFLVFEVNEKGMIYQN